MATIESAFFDLSYLDRLARIDSSVHRVDPRIKVIITALFVLVVVSFDKYTIGPMLPFALVLMVIMTMGRIPITFLMKKLLIVSPFAVMIGIFNPVFDTQPMLQIGPLLISGGWLSFLSILIRVGLTVSAVLILIGTTGFNAVCMAMVKLGMPRIFAVQLLMLYRYIFVLIEEGLSMYQARALRSFGNRGLSMKVFSHMIGQLLLKTLDRAQRVHLAMLCRGFDGTIRIQAPGRIRVIDLAVLGLLTLLFFFFRLYDLPLMVGKVLTGLLS